MSLSLSSEDYSAPALGNEQKRKQHHTRDRRVSWEQRSLDDDESNDDAMILEPHDLWNGTCHLNEQELQDLFVEMCFFARLGYVQPPSCLKCTYKETMSTEESKACQRWCVWRRDANTMIHPNKLDGNIVIVRCCAARKLLKGSTVQGRRWDEERKLVV